MRIQPLSPHNLRRVLPSLICLALAGCILPEDPASQSVWRDDINTPVQRKIRLDVDEAGHILRAEKGHLAAGESERLGAFLAAQGAPWSMDVHVQPLSAEGDKAYPELKNILEHLGVQEARIIRVPRGKPAGDGDVLVTARFVRASATGCPDWRRSNLMDISEQNSSNFGCATADSLARMIADPRELQGGRPLGAGYGPHTVGAVDRYRTDKIKPLIKRSGGSDEGGSGGSGDQ